MEEVCERGNLERALKRVESNRGSPGVDGMSVGDLRGYLVDHLAGHTGTITEWGLQTDAGEAGGHTQAGRWSTSIGRPHSAGPVYPAGGVADLAGILGPYILGAYSEHSYGFRPGRSAHQAVTKAQQYIGKGRRLTVDIDLEKFFDRVNHDRLMARLAQRIGDKAMLKLIRAYLNAGVMEYGLVSQRTEGTPQGGPLSPFLSNVALDELDRELERRGHCFVRYADDFNIYVHSYVHSRRAGERVMENVTRWITRKLKLKVNHEKSAVDRPSRRKFLGFSFGFSFMDGTEPRVRIAPESLARFKERVRELTRRTRTIGMDRMVNELSVYLRGWLGYYGKCQTPSILIKLDSWIRRRLRNVVWKQWRRGRTRYAGLRAQGGQKDLAAQTAGSSHGSWRISRSPALSVGFPNAYFDSLGLVRLAS